MAHAGNGARYVEGLNLTWCDTERGRGPTGTAARTGQTRIVHNVATDPIFAPWRDDALKHGYASSMSLPLKKGDETFGVLSIYSAEHDSFSEREIKIVEETADDLAFGIVGQRLRLAHQQAEETIRRLAYFDPLTGLANRTHLVQRLNEVVGADRGERREARLTLLSLDLDRFSEINSALGYNNGNRLLQEIGNRLQQSNLGATIVARSGEDEFALLFADADAAEAEAIARDVHALLESPINLDGIDVQAQASIGVAHFLDGGEDADSFLRRAVIARDHAKQHNIGYAVYQGNTEMEDRKRIALIADLHRAITHNELTLAFQPKLEMSNHSLCGAEVLVRWRHPQRGMVPPIEFIRLAEHTGLIKPLTDWILETAIRQQAAWQGSPADTPLAVNLSARNLHDPRLLTQFETLLERWSVPPERLQIEITESTLMEDPGGARQILKQLSSRGIKIYIDDFGTGYSSLSYLATLPVHGVKIDRSFINEMMTQHEQRTIVSTVISLAHALGLKVVAEGVENDSQYEMLRRMGCDQVQGYLISPPMPPEGFDDWCRASGRGYPARIGAGRR